MNIHELSISIESRFVICFCDPASFGTLKLLSNGIFQLGGPRICGNYSNETTVLLPCQTASNRKKDSWNISSARKSGMTFVSFMKVKEADVYLKIGPTGKTVYVCSVMLLQS